MDYVGYALSLTQFLHRETGLMDMYSMFHPITAADIIDTDRRAARYDMRVTITNTTQTEIFVGYIKFSSGEIFEQRTTLNAVPFLQRWLRELA
jgi:hypothetical protein